MAQPHDNRETTKFKTSEFAPPPPQKAPVLVVIRGAATDLGRYWPIEAPCVVGRGPKVDIAVLSEGVSRRHCRFTPVDGRVFVEDLGSTNGTFVNGARIRQPWPLKPGNYIGIGDTTLRLQEASNPEIYFIMHMSQRSGFDNPTGLLLRPRFEGDLVRALEYCSAERQGLGVMMLDMDGIKRINDKHGHIYGGFAIIEAGRILRRAVGAMGAACLWGGDEFAAFLINKNLEETTEFARSIVRQVYQNRYEKDGIIVHPSVSIGVAAFPDSGRTVAELLKRADNALYEAKLAGGNCVMADQAASRSHRRTTVG